MRRASSVGACLLCDAASTGTQPPRRAAQWVRDDSSTGTQPPRRAAGWVVGDHRLGVMWQVHTRLGGVPAVVSGSVSGAAAETTRCYSQNTPGGGLELPCAVLSRCLSWALGDAEGWCVCSQSDGLSTGCQLMGAAAQLCVRTETHSTVGVGVCGCVSQAPWSSQVGQVTVLRVSGLPSKKRGWHWVVVQ
jgi:hypothetical protein